jgi:hypothetical protein
MIHHLRWIREMFHMFSNSIDWKIVGQGGMRFEKAINDYYGKNKHDLT